MTMLKADGYDKAVIGVAERSSSDPVIAYDANKCIEILKQQGMSDTQRQLSILNTTCSVHIWVQEPPYLYGGIPLKK